jgi:ribosomal protein S18 acetylase RimI-like enzyme
VTTRTFVPATPAERPEVERLMRAAFTPYMQALGREIPSDHYAWFGEAIPAGDVFLVREGNDLIGAMATKRGEGDLVLALIAVAPTRQKSGIASWMIGEVEKVARARGLATMSLVTAEKMEDRVRLYSRHGFRIMRRGPQEQGKDPHIRVYMTKTLG